MKSEYSLSPVNWEWDSRLMLCFRVPRDIRIPVHPRRVSGCHLPPTERNQWGKVNRLLFGAAEREAESQSASLNIFWHLALSSVCTQIFFFILTLVGLYKISEKWCILWPRFIYNWNINFWKDKVGLNAYIISQHLKNG